MRHNAGSEKRMLRETGRRFKDEQRAFLPGKKGSKNPNGDQVWSLRRLFVPAMKNNRAPGCSRGRVSNPGLVAPPAVRPPDEKQSATPTQGAPQDEAQEGIPAEIKFGMLDGNAVRFTSREAWWLVDGVWRPISPGEVLLNAAVMREARFNQFFPEVPRLPSNAFKADKLQN